jgi:hypothetical protein
MIPKEIRVEAYVENEATAVGTHLPLTSHGSSSQHFSFIRQASILSDSSYLLEVYPVLSFSRTGGAVATYNALTNAAQAMLLPLPNLSLRHATPDAFGTPLDFGGWSTRNDSFLFVVPTQFVMPANRAV